MYEEKDNIYLLMQHIPGQTLESLWPSLDRHERQIVLQQLRGLLDDMRSLTPPTPSYYGGVNHGPVPYFLFWTRPLRPQVSGPFSTEAEFCLGLVNKLEEIHTDNGYHTSRVAWLRRHLPVCLIGHPPTFTHGDLQKKNVMVERVRYNTSDHPSFRLTILDWEDAGWYPSYFEYFISYTGFRWDDDWPQMIEICLDPFPVETMIILNIYHEIFF